MRQNLNIQFTIKSDMFLNALNIRTDTAPEKVNIIYLRIVSIYEI
jgi:hypothetical protein